MSEAEIRGAGEESGSDSSASRSHSFNERNDSNTATSTSNCSGSNSCSSNSASSNSSSSSSSSIASIGERGRNLATSTANDDSQASKPCLGSNLTNGSNWHPTCSAHDNTKPSSSRAAADVTEESTCNTTENISEKVIQPTQHRTGSKCDTRPEDSRFGRQNSLSFNPTDESDPHLLPSTSHSFGDSFGDLHQSMRRATLRTVPSASSSAVIDTNNNRNASATPRNESLSGLKKNNFSKSASGIRLVSRNEGSAKVCDCLSQNCGEKEHSNRRRFIESYYNNRTRLPTANAMSTSNISTPLNRLSECDEITKRLLSSPIRTMNLVERPDRRAQIGDTEKSRRASLGTNALMEQVSLFTSSQFNSIELNSTSAEGDKDHHRGQKQPAHAKRTTGNPLLSDDGDGKLKQQQGRSLSVCQEDTSKSRFRNNSSHHSANLNRAVSLACESSSPRQLMTIIPLFGCDMKALEQFIRLGWILPPPIESAIDHILAHGINAIGIFRKSGVKSRILTLKKRIETDQNASMDEINRDNEFSIYDVADLVKMWFRELKPVPLMTKDLIRLISSLLNQQSCDRANYTQASQQARGGSKDEKPRSNEELSRSLRRAMNERISPTHKALFSKAITFFATISSNGEVNQMSSQNLAICLTPSLCATESDQTSILVAQGALKYCIDNYQILF